MMAAVFLISSSILCSLYLSISTLGYGFIYILGRSPRVRDYSDPIAGLIEFPFLPRPRISADVRFSADVFSAPFWVSSFGAASVQLLSLRFCCLCVPPRSLSSRQIT
ncbi:hypothetical protein V6N12_007846 [Hibiscus sabdariffa]|uniref:Secreted peptide n=1 Tax=Hibiscus sabdariffa TaxID=183260 RepID=A0ABR2F2Y6_9ROSI